jgi:lauroyl/myristoyl acyltransferase
VKAAWKRVRYRLEWLVLMSVLKVVPLFSRNACYRFGGAVGALAARVDRRGYRVAMANLEAAFGDRYTAAERAAIARESYQHFARTMLDLFWSPRLRADNYREYIEFDEEGIERTRRETAEEGHTGVVGSFHYSNFEWLSLACGWLGYPSAITTQELKNPLLDVFFQKLRERSGHTTVPRRGAVLKLFNMLRKGGRVALLVDTTLPPHHPTIVIDCFGLKTIITVAHAWLQARTRLPMLPLNCEPLGGGRYRVVAHPLVRPPEDATHREIAQACWDAFEPTVRENPAPWLWMYKHWRYKPAVGGERYPFYAQESSAFEQVAARENYAPLERSTLPGATTATAR